ncbi:MAG TPA: DUF1819 family protein [Thermotogota bacterium]|nr:DUF1819 family protein [Thermotogota bacterium]HRW92397.1 DUF1819 family protein [Thermotogota bacterium]
MKEPGYSMSFCGASLSVHAMVQVAKVFLEEGEDPDRVKERVLAQNLLQSRNQRSQQRIFQEIRLRLQALSTSEKHYLVRAPLGEQKMLCWIAVCRSYPFVAEFAQKVLGTRFSEASPRLQHADFDAFFYASAQTHPALETLRLSTQKKLRQVLFRMMREAGFLEKGGSILPLFPDESLFKALEPDHLSELRWLPVSPSLSRRWVP